MTKSELRQLYLAKRMTLSPKDIKDHSQKIFENFILQFNPIENQKISIFLSLDKFNEVETSFFIQYFFKNNIRVFVPKVLGNKMISVEIFPDSEFKKNQWDIKEPVSNKDAQIKDYNFVITPLVYCDAFGNRIGYGKGFYDAFFKEINNNVSKIGLGFFNPKENISDVSKEDVPLDYLVLSDKILSFKGLV